MNEADWMERCATVRDAMAAHVWPRTCPIAAAEPGGRAYAWGTGNYVQLLGEGYLLTNSHVFTEASDVSLGHLPVPDADFVHLARADLSLWPVDLGLSLLDADRALHPSSFVVPREFDARFDPVADELLFWVGYPGTKALRHEPVTELKRRANWFDGPIEMPAVPFASQVPQEAPPALQGFDANVHVAVHYPAKAHRTPGTLEDVPNPKGMSGSLLWDTKYVRCLRTGEEWSPEKARVCGLVWAAHPHPELVVATRIEHVVTEILRFVRLRRAYSVWVENGRPENTALDDWLKAESEIRALA